MQSCVRDEQASTDDAAELRARVAQLEAALSSATAREAAAQARAVALQISHDKLRDAFRQLQLEIELLRRRIFVASAERVDSAQLELEFAAKKKELAALALRIGEDVEPTRAADEKPAGNDPEPARPPRKKPSGRRDFADADLPVDRVEILDPEHEGNCERIGFEESFKIGRRKGGFVKFVVARAKYRVKTEEPATGVARNWRRIRSTSGGFVFK